MNVILLCAIQFERASLFGHSFVFVVQKKLFVSVNKIVWYVNLQYQNNHAHTVN